MTTHADRSSFFVALVVVDVLAGLADAMSGPYLVLFLVDQAGLSPLLLSAVLTARAVAGIAFATGLGGWVDRKPGVAPLLLALAGSAVGYALLGFTTNFALLLVIAAIPVAIGAAVFSQSIALVRRGFEHASFHTASRALGVLRASWSLAWAIGPAIGAVRCRGVRVSRRVLRQRRLRRRRPGDACPCASEAGFRWRGSREPTKATERRSGDHPRLHGARLIPYRHVPGLNSAGHRADHVAGRREERRRTGRTASAPASKSWLWARSSGGRSSAPSGPRSWPASPLSSPILSCSRWRGRSAPCSGPKSSARSALGS